jgi:hypothetical protein
MASLQRKGTTEMWTVILRHVAVSGLGCRPAPNRLSRPLATVLRKVLHTAKLSRHFIRRSVAVLAAEVHVTVRPHGVKAVAR